jgi:hypothetical protein
MSPQYESVIERFVRYPNTLLPHEYRAASRLVASDPIARRLADFYREFYDSLASVQGSAAPPPEQAVAPGLRPGGSTLGPSPVTDG